MKKLIVLTAVLFWTVSCQEKGKSLDSKPLANQDSTVTLKVQVLDNLDSVKKKLPKSTEVVAESIFRFKVLEVINGTYSKAEIKIKIVTPLEEIDSKQLENGKTYTYKLTPGSYINSEMKKEPTDYYEIWENTLAGGWH